jgi:hypothetical protein
MAKLKYEDDRIERTRAGQALQGVCKDCHSGSLNNELNPAFYLFDEEENPVWRCISCNSDHLDIL